MGFIIVIVSIFLYLFIGVLVTQHACNLDDMEYKGKDAIWLVLMWPIMAYFILEYYCDDNDHWFTFTPRHAA